MHVLSELRNPLFDAPDRQRALRALQMSRILRENNGAKAWQAVKNMIDKVVAEHDTSTRTEAQSFSAFTNPTVPMSTSVQMETPSNSNVSVYPVLEAIPSYALHASSGQDSQERMPVQLQQVQSEPELLQPMASMQDQTAPCWDDINLNNINNIVGDVQPTPGIVPDFDFVSNLTDESSLLTDGIRASGAIPSITRMSQLQCLCKIAIFHLGLADDAHEAS